MVNLSPFTGFWMSRSYEDLWTRIIRTRHGSELRIVRVVIGGTAVAEYFRARRERTRPHPVLRLRRRPVRRT